MRPHATQQLACCCRRLCFPVPNHNLQHAGGHALRRAFLCWARAMAPQAHGPELCSRHGASVLACRAPVQSADPCDILVAFWTSVGTLFVAPLDLPVQARAAWRQHLMSTPIPRSAVSVTRPDWWAPFSPEALSHADAQLPSKRSGQARHKAPLVAVARAAACDTREHAAVMAAWH